MAVADVSGAVKGEISAARREAGRPQWISALQKRISRDWLRAGKRDV